MIQQFSSGGVLLNYLNQIYLLHNKVRDEWVLPKGKLNPRETAFVAAIREIKEETGFLNFRAIDMNPIHISHYNFTENISGTEYDKYSTYYLFRLLNSEKINTKEMEEEGLEGAWFDLTDALDKVTHKDTKKAISSGLKNLENKNVDLILLGGNSIKNLDWIKDVGENFENDFKDQKILYYNHWLGPDLGMNLNLETTKLAFFPSCYKMSNNYKIFAKSAGIMVVLKAIKDFKLRPARCVFVGFPSNILEEWQVDYIPYLQSLDIKSFLFQNSEDPFGSFQKTKEVFEKLGIKNIELIEEKGDTHNYNNFAKYLEQLSN